ncbi:MAG: phosphoserine phosphatase SerB [Alphaproteobacteria bacterium]|nr:phosphoserine phosphatase SerB [Alphaproteobacteria bacterium]
MNTCLVLIAPRGGLDESRIGAVRAALGLAGWRPGNERWLSLGEAWEAAVDAPDAHAIEQAARLATAGGRIDVAVLPQAGRRKMLLVADMESTMIENELLVEMAELAGLGSAMAEETARTMRGELDFKASLRARVKRFAGQKVALLDLAAARIRPIAGGHTLVATMRANGAATALVSGGFTVFAEPFARSLGFDQVAANRLEVAAGTLTGAVAEPILGAEEKLQELVRLAGERGLGLDAALSVGDGANDVPMLSAAGLGVAFHPKPVAAAAARARIDHGDLSALLFLQGYRRDEFVGA